jgi:hypothetical protein
MTTDLVETRLQVLLLPVNIYIEDAIIVSTSIATAIYTQFMTPTDDNILRISRSHLHVLKNILFFNREINLINIYLLEIFNYLV